MKLAEITDGIVTNIIKVDPDNIPDWAMGWPSAEGAGIGFSYDGATFTPPQPDLTALATTARVQRDRLLGQSDWTQVADAPVDQAAWATYRQALRDMPAQAGFPENIVWPVAPE